MADYVSWLTKLRGMYAVEARLPTWCTVRGAGGRAVSLSGVDVGVLIVTLSLVVI